MSVCLNHTERPASRRCRSCLKPFCEECAYEAEINGEVNVYCSRKCAEDTRKFTERMQMLGIEKKPPSLGDLLRGPFLFLLGLGFLVGCAWLISPNLAPAPLGSWIKVHVHGENPPRKPAAPGTKHH